MRYCHGAFPENVSPTIGASFLQRRVIVGDIEVSLQIWDTAGKHRRPQSMLLDVHRVLYAASVCRAGQERFRSMAPMYYRGAKAAVLVFDVTNEESFRRVTTWLRDLRAHADPDVVICLAGNKCDKTPSFDLKACEEEARGLGAKFFQTSALTGEGVNEVFESLSISAVEVFNDRNKSRDGANASKDGSVSLKGAANGAEQSDSNMCC